MAELLLPPGPLPPEPLLPLLLAELEQPTNISKARQGKTSIRLFLNLPIIFWFTPIGTVPEKIRGRWIKLWQWMTKVTAGRFPGPMRRPAVALYLT
jgi:hypothetical protein